MTSVQETNRSERIPAISAALLGGAIGDALGVPVEFASRATRRRDPVIHMREYGVHHQPAGTWSDDTSLTFCLAESLTDAGIDYRDQASRFTSWMFRGHWTPHGDVFDIGNATRAAIYRLAAGINPTDAGLAGDRHCGNGSLMRIAPVGLYLAFASASERSEAAQSCSYLTHGHQRCQLACVMYTQVVALLVQGLPIADAFAGGQALLKSLVIREVPQEASHFARLLSPSFAELEEREIASSGYVIHCLEASLWCALRADSFRSGVLTAVNLGEDTDTTGAVAGTLLGLRFGLDQIPQDWINALARVADIRILIERFRAACHVKWASAGE